MSPKQIVALAIRLFVIWTAINLLRQLPGAVTFFRGNLQDTLALTCLMVGLASMVGICLALWFFPLTIAGKLLPGSDTPPTQGAAPEQWFAVGCSLIGVWALASSLPFVVLYYVPLLHYAGSTEGRFAWDLLAVLDFARALGESLLGLYLLLGAKGLRGLIDWARTAGTG